MDEFCVWMCTDCEHPYEQYDDMDNAIHTRTLVCDLIRRLGLLDLSRWIKSMRKYTESKR